MGIMKEIQGLIGSIIGGLFVLALETPSATARAYGNAQKSMQEIAHHRKFWPELWI
jgi:hypothetical protein